MTFVKKLVIDTSAEFREDKLQANTIEDSIL